MIPFGFMMTSVCKTYWQTVLAQAICIGIGNGLLFLPSVAILPQYFTTHKALANGIAASGSSFGGIIYPIVFRQLYPKIGFQWATRVLGFISLATAGFSFLIMRPRIIPKHKRHLTDLGAFKEPPYALFCLGMFFGFIGMFPLESRVLQHASDSCRLLRSHLLPPAICYIERHYRRKPWFLSLADIERSIHCWPYRSEYHNRSDRTIKCACSNFANHWSFGVCMDRRHKSSGHSGIRNPLRVLFRWLRIATRSGSHHAVSRSSQARHPYGPIVLDQFTLLAGRCTSVRSHIEADRWLCGFAVVLGLLDRPHRNTSRYCENQ